MSTVRLVVRRGARLAHRHHRRVRHVVVELEPGELGAGRAVTVTEAFWRAAVRKVATAWPATAAVP